MKLSTVLLLSAATAFAANNHDGKRLIRLSDEKAEWLTEAEIVDLALRDIGYIDDTDGEWTRLFEIGKARANLEAGQKEYPQAVAYPEVVAAVKSKIKTADLKLSLETFVNQFVNRLYNSTEGKQSCGWIYDQVNEFATTVSRPDLKLTVRKFEHPWGQYSVIARIEPNDKLANDVVIASAHQDSLNWKDRYNDNRNIAPGADDDGSGTVTILESLKYLIGTDKWKPIRPVEFHWYSAEEVGLLGSQAVAKEYAEANTDVYAQMQQDMTGYVKPGTKPVVSFMTDYTNNALNTFLTKCVTAYLDIPFSFSQCGYSCSDHFSWNKTGYPGSMPFETDFKDLNRNIHSQSDTLATIDYNHIAEFTKLTTSYIVELTQKKSSC